MSHRDVPQPAPVRASAPSARAWRLALASILLAVALAALYLFDLADVPYHPDESSYLLMSPDFITLFLDHNAPALAWLPGQPQPVAVQKRLLDAPMPRYAAGLGWWLAGYSSAGVNVDWQWGAPWEANLSALPAPGVLLAARTPFALLGALSAVVLFWIGLDLGGAAVGLTAALLLALDPLMLLHARRAMAESLLVFFSVLAVWGALRWLRACDTPGASRARLLAGSSTVGVLVGLAVCAKQTELALLPPVLLLGALALLGAPRLAGRSSDSVSRSGVLANRAVAALLAAAGIGAASALTFYLLNPVLLSDPIGVGLQMVTSRVVLANAQVAVNGSANPGLVLASPAARVTAAGAQLYWTMPSFWDVPLYLDRLQPPAERYLAVGWHAVLRETPANLLLIAFSLLGAVLSAARLVRRGLGAATRAEQFLWLWTLCTLALLALSIPLNWQRYFMPLLPASRLFAALGVVAAARFVVQHCGLPAALPRVAGAARRA